MASGQDEMASEANGSESGPDTRPGAAGRLVKCPQCGHEFPADAKWGAKDWALYLVAVGPIGLMALVIVSMGVFTLLRFLGLISR